MRGQRFEVRLQRLEPRGSQCRSLGLFYLCNLTSDLFNGFTYNLTSNL